MKCLKCGHCCKFYSVVIVLDPDKIKGNSIGEEDVDNFAVHDGMGVPCPHLRGNEAGKYSCAIHDKPWYGETPCAQFGQIESSPDEDCRVGRYIMEKMGVIINDEHISHIHAP
jgi:hypothetical protein